MQRLDPNAFLPLTSASFEILLSLVDGDKHGYAIMRSTKGSGGEDLLPGTLYRALNRLLDSDLVLKSQAPAGDEQTDARRQYYRITDLGRRVIEAEVRRLEGRLQTARTLGLSARARGAK